MIRKVTWCVMALVGLGCTSHWKVSGPNECVQMCRGWGMELTGMVGVGNQDPTGEGATACVCELPKRAATTPGSSGIAASSAAMIVAIQEAERQQQQTQQHAVAVPH